MSAIHAMMLAGIVGSGGATAFAVLNSADKASIITLSSGDLVAAMDAASSTTGRYYSVRANQGKSSGKWYWETDLYYSNAWCSILALLTSGHSLDTTDYPGQSATSVGGPYTDWRVYKNAVSTLLNGVYYNGGQRRVVRHKLNMDAGTYEVAVEHQNFSTVATGLTGTYYPALCLRETAGTTGSIYGNANFGQEQFRYQVPSGYKAGVFTGADPAVQIPWADASSWVPNASNSTWGGYTARMRLASSLFPALSKLRLQFQCRDALITVADVFVGKAATTGDSYDYDTTPTRVLTLGANGFTLQSTQSVVTDAVNLSLAAADDLLISVYYTTATQVAVPAANPTGWTTWYKNANDAATVNATGYTSFGSPVSVSKVEYAV